MLELNFNPFPVLHSERLLLRKITPADTSQVFLMRTDPACMAYIGKPLMKEKEEALALINSMLENLEKNEGIT